MDKTREDHSEVSAQLFAAYARGKEAKELAIILGEASLSQLDKQFMKFSLEFENLFIRQGEFENRAIEATLDLGWKLLTHLPARELKRIREEFIEKYLPADAKPSLAVSDDNPGEKNASEG